MYYAGVFQPTRCFFEQHVAFSNNTLLFRTNTCNIALKNSRVEVHSDEKGESECTTREFFKAMLHVFVRKSNVLFSGVAEKGKAPYEDGVAEKGKAPMASGVAEKGKAPYDGFVFSFVVRCRGGRVV